MPDTVREMFGGSFFIGRFFNINVRVHFTLLIVAFFRIQAIMGASQLGNERVWMAPALVIGLFLSILLHEFGHSLSCKLFKGDADEILMWPLGGLAFCRPPFHPTAHLVTTVCGPLVTLVIWLILGIGIPGYINRSPFEDPSSFEVFVIVLGDWNKHLLFFNLLPGFPMDGGRMLRDSLWHAIGYTKATHVAVWVGRITGGLMIAGGLNVFSTSWLPDIFHGGIWMVAIGALVIWSNMNIDRLMAAENSGQAGYSIKEHFKHAKRKRVFEKQMSEIKGETLHRCVTCDRTEESDPGLEFRVSSIDDEEYCLEHLPKRPDTS